MFYMKPLTFKITEDVEVSYVDGGHPASPWTLGQPSVFDGKGLRIESTRAVILDEDGDEIDAVSGPASEDWLPDQWDAVITGGGYVRVGEWQDDFACQVLPVAAE